MDTHTIKQTIAFCSRIGLAAILIQQAIATGAPGLFDSWSGMIHHSGLGPLIAYAAWPLAAVLLLFGIWLALGMCSRVLACWSALAMTGLSVACVMHDKAAIDCHGVAVAAIVLALPVMILGGGRFALLRRGWSVPL